MNQHTGYEYIRETYGVPAAYGVKIKFRPLPDLIYFGYICSARDGKLWMKCSHALDLNGHHDLKNKRVGPLHPTWKIEYL